MKQSKNHAVQDARMPVVLGILPLRTLAHPCASQHAQERPLFALRVEKGHGWTFSTTC